MTTPAQTVVEWLQQLPIPWLVAGEVGSKDVLSYGTVTDDQIELVREAVLARFPDNAPVDALSHVGNDRSLIQGVTETDDDFRTRLKVAWDDWARAGTPLELLMQLATHGYGGVIIVQQNGLYFEVTGPPFSADPTADETIADTGIAEVPIVSMFDNSRIIPAGTPWWYFGPETDFCSRYAIISNSLGKTAYVTSVTFTGTEDGSPSNPWPTATWTLPFSSTNFPYQVNVGPPVVTSGTPPLSVYASSPTMATTGIQIAASAPWTGTVGVTAYANGTDPVNPGGQFADLPLWSKLIKTWGPANATCVAIYAIEDGYALGWPIRTLGSGILGPAEVTTYVP